jgi:hypothetical protein
MHVVASATLQSTNMRVVGVEMFTEISRQLGHILVIGVLVFCYMAIKAGLLIHFQLSYWCTS